MFPAIDPCGYLWANQGTWCYAWWACSPDEADGPQCTLHNLLRPLVCCFKDFFQPITCMKPIYFLKKSFFEIKNTFVWNKKHGFQENKHYFLEKQQGFSLFLGYCPESLSKVCCNPALKVCSETFNPSLQVCIESFSQTCNPPWKFDWKFATNFQ